MIPRAPLAGSALVLTLALTRLAHATPDQERAEVLYEEGRRLLDSGRVAEACATLAESQRLDPATGTLLNLARCHEREGKLASSLREYEAARERARADVRPDRVAYADERLVDLRGRVSRVRVVLGDGTPRDVRVTLDGEAVPAESLGESVPVDPGAHEVRATADGRTFTETVSVTAERQRLDVVVRIAPAVAALPPRGGAPEADTSPTRSFTLPIVLFGVGAAATGVGTFFGLRAFDAWDERNAGCSAGGCTDAAIRAGDRAGTNALAANVGVGIGVVALAAGTFFLVRELTVRGSSAPRRAAPSGRPGPWTW